MQVPLVYPRGQQAADLLAAAPGPSQEAGLQGRGGHQEARLLPQPRLGHGRGQGGRTRVYPAGGKNNSPFCKNISRTIWQLSSCEDTQNFDAEFTSKQLTLLQPDSEEESKEPIDVQKYYDEAFEGFSFYNDKFE